MLLTGGTGRPSMKWVIYITSKANPDKCLARRGEKFFARYQGDGGLMLKNSRALSAKNRFRKRSL